jgi:DNA-binding transcriptional LysR family regulator
VDGIVAPERTQALPLVRSAELFRDEWVCVMSADNRLAPREPLGVRDLQDVKWIVPFYRTQHSPLAPPPAVRQLMRLGIRPQVAIGVESYLAVPQLVAGGSRVALMQRRLAAQFTDLTSLRVCSCPGEPDPIVEALWWHEDLDADPAHVWLRTALAALGRQL